MWVISESMWYAGTQDYRCPASQIGRSEDMHFKITPVQLRRWYKKKLRSVKSSYTWKQSNVKRKYHLSEANGKPCKLPCLALDHVRNLTDGAIQAPVNHCMSQKASNSRDKVKKRSPTMPGHDKMWVVPETAHSGVLTRSMVSLGDYNAWSDTDSLSSSGYSNQLKRQNLIQTEAEKDSPHQKTTWCILILYHQKQVKENMESNLFGLLFPNIFYMKNQALIENQPGLDKNFIIRHSPYMKGRSLVEIDT